MTFDLHRSIEILERTPAVLDKLLRGLPDHWSRVNEGGETWSAYDVLGHLIHGEHTDWMERLHRCLSDDPETKKFRPFDRTAMFAESVGRSLEDLLDEFALLRLKNMEALRALDIRPGDLHRTGVHPVFGAVTLRQLLSTWMAHDMDHLQQIARVIAKQYKEEVGPWQEYLRIMKA